MSFRPLARQIGSYTRSKKKFNERNWIEFPAPLEVDRELYPKLSELLKLHSERFRPLSRQIGSYTYSIYGYCRFIMFPAPLKVDRQLYITCAREKGLRTTSFRPLSRQIGSYTVVEKPEVPAEPSFRPLARQIGSYTNLTTQILNFTQASFRPLSRQIGIYTELLEMTDRELRAFPSPLEVDRELYSY